MVRLLLHSKLYDHQCGFKAFRRGPLLELLDEIENQHWFWDTELLVRAQHRGYRSLSSLFTGGMEDQARSISQRISLEWVRRSSASGGNCFSGLIFRKGQNIPDSLSCNSDSCTCCNLSGRIRGSGKYKTCLTWNTGSCIFYLLRFLAPERDAFPADP